MIKNALKTFFKNLLYVFVPMGIIYLFFILIVFGMVSAVFSAAGNSLTAFFSLVNETVSGAEGVAQDYFAYAFGLIDWNGNFFDILKEVINTDWVYKTVVGFLQTLDVSVAGFESQSTAIVNDFVHSLTVTLTVSVAALVVAVFFANFITRMVIRRKNARRNLAKKLFAWLLESTLVTAIFALTAYLAAFWSFGAAIMAVVYAAVISFTALLSAWLLHGRGKVNFRKAVNFRNICAYFVASLIIVAIVVAALALLFVITDAALTLLVAVPLIVYTANIIDVNADSYILDCAHSAEKPTPAGENTQQASDV